MAEFITKIPVDETKLKSTILDIIEDTEKILRDPCQFQLTNVQLSLKWKLKPTITDNNDEKKQLKRDDSVEKDTEFMESKMVESKKEELQQLEKDNKEQPINKVVDDYGAVMNCEPFDSGRNSKESEKEAREIHVCGESEESLWNAYQIILDNKRKEFVVLHPRKGNLCEEIFNDFIQFFEYEETVQKYKCKITDDAKREYPSLILCLCTSRVEDDLSSTLSLIGELPTRVMLIGLESCEMNVKPNKQIHSRHANGHGIKDFTNILYSGIKRKCYKCRPNSSAIEAIRTFFEEF